MRMKIGIPGWSLGENSFGVSKHYLDWATLWGRPTIIMPNDEYDETITAIVVPGGMDTSPLNYGQAPGFYTGPSDPYKEWFVAKLLPKYIERQHAVFGICLGFQQLVVHFGGELVQNLHYHEQSPDRWHKAHKLTLTRRAKALLQEDPKEYFVNSHHHQAAVVAGFPEDLQVVATAANHEGSPIVEAFQHKTLPIAGVQYHPEEWRDKLSTMLFTAIINESVKRRELAAL